MTRKNEVTMTPNASFSNEPGGKKAERPVPAEFCTPPPLGAELLAMVAPLIVIVLVVVPAFSTPPPP